MIEESEKELDDFIKNCVEKDPEGVIELIKFVGVINLLGSTFVLAKCAAFLLGKDLFAEFYDFLISNKKGEILREEELKVKNVSRADVEKVSRN